MLALLLALVGVVVGWVLKTVSDLFAERRANKRADSTWRREKYVDAVADLLSSARELMAADSRMSRAIASLSTAQSGNSAAILAECHAQHRAAVEAQDPRTTATIRALESVRLDGPDRVVAGANAVWDAIQPGPTPDSHGDWRLRAGGSTGALRTACRDARRGKPRALIQARPQRRLPACACALAGCVRRSARGDGLGRTTSRRDPEQASVAAGWAYVGELSGAEMTPCRCGGARCIHE